jgi:hypothetical protein
LIAVGRAILFVPRDPAVDTVPFPGTDLSVKFSAKLRSEGDYRLDVAMPRKIQSAALDSEVVPCSLSVVISRAGMPALQKEVKAISLYEEFAWAGIQYFKSESWHLSRGDYDVEITSHGDCPAVMSRGAALSLQPEQNHITERFLAKALLYYAGIVLLGAGLIGLILYEFKKP